MTKYLKYILTNKCVVESPFEKRFFNLGLQKNREELAKRINLDLTSKNQLDCLEEAVTQELLSSKILVEDGKNIIGDRSYNMAENYKFRYLIYLEYFAPFFLKIRKKKMLIKKSLNNNINKIEKL